MGKYPKIKLKIDIERDVSNGVSFVRRNLSDGRPEFITQFLPDPFQYILNKSFSSKERDKIIEEYTKHIHKIKKEEIKQGLKDAIKNWQKVEKRYFQLVDRIFKRRAWPKGNYRGIASIFFMFPRYIDQKIFFFPFQHRIPEYANKVTAHELLHFMFFDFIKEKYGLKEGARIHSKSDEYLWQVSEVFNNVMEDWEPYVKIFKTKPRPYSGIEKIFQKMKKQWSQKKDIDWLLDQWLK